MSLIYQSTSYVKTALKCELSVWDVYPGPTCMITVFSKTLCYLGKELSSCRNQWTLKFAVQRTLPEKYEQWTTHSTWFSCSIHLSFLSLHFTPLSLPFPSILHLNSLFLCLSLCKSQWKLMESIIEQGSDAFCNLAFTQVPSIDVWSTCLAGCFTGLTTRARKASQLKFYGELWSYFVIDSIKYHYMQRIFYSSLHRN